MPTQPINIAQTLEYIYVGVVMGHPIAYTPPVGGFVANDETEFNAIVFIDPDYSAPAWSDILTYNDASYPWTTMRDVLGNWYAVKMDAFGALQITSVPSLLAPYITIAGASSSFVPLARTINGKVLSSDVTLTASDITGLPGTQVQTDWNATTGLGVLLNKPSTFTPSAHNHAASDVNSGTFVDARIAQSNVTQHQSALSISSGQVTGTKTSSFISDFTEASQDAVGGALSPEFVYNDSGNSISLRSKTFNNSISRTAGTAFQISTTQDSGVSYKIPVTSSATLIAGSRAQATLQYADNSGMTTNLKTVDSDDFGIGSGLVVVGYGTLKLVGKIPSGKWALITVSAITGSPTIGSCAGQEVLF